MLNHLPLKMQIINVNALRENYKMAGHDYLRSRVTNDIMCLIAFYEITILHNATLKDKLNNNNIFTWLI